MADYIEREKVDRILNAALNEIDKLDGIFFRRLHKGLQKYVGHSY